MTYQPASNPWDVANNPPEQTFEASGLVTISSWWCMFTPDGKAPYDERTIDPKTGNQPRRYAAIDLKIEPLLESGMQYPVERNMVAEFGDWKEVTLPSLKDIGILDASVLNGKYAHIQLIPTGTYVSKKDGQEKKLTAVKFLAVYDTREQCLAAMNGDNPTSPTPVVAPVPSNGNGNAEKETALKFAKAFVANAIRQAGGDLDKARGILALMIANQPVISKHYTVDSPEIVDMMAESLS